MTEQEVLVLIQQEDTDLKALATQLATVLTEITDLKARVQNTPGVPQTVADGIMALGTDIAAVKTGVQAADDAAKPAAPTT